ncbi:mechanosensitive ion channel domain-containing protein [Cellulomonas triticagri]|uniref:mechanosensitive ion channel domain-containing protein n=1 Tax=Cellulomonas triticagri TaxID=2483352 RepID=UPI001F226FB3|nr:mechanosensitive ion channel domain-containing protein [Cellulomonas triticagri]
MPAAAGEEAVDTARDWIVPVLSVVGGVLIAFVVALAVGFVVRSAARKSFVAADLARRAKQPLRAVLIVIAVWVALRISVPGALWETSGWMGALQHVLLIALIAAATWLVGTLAFVVEDAALSRYRVDVKDNRHARRVRTQVQLLRRITVAVLVIVAVAAVLLTFPGVSAFGASLLASAGVLSIVAGLAAQSSLANVFAGLQLAFTDAIRVDDVVIADDEWGRIEEITLTYVVVHVWDDRRLILPSTYFTQTPFENWTRRAADLLGTVELDVDWQVPVDDLRGELNRLLEATDLWDHRVGILQVTDAVHGWVRLRALASAVDAPTLFDLRCYLREGLVAYLQREAPQGLPRTRIETTRGTPLPVVEPREAARPATGAHAAVPAPESGQQDARLFTGSVEAMERSRSFAGPGEDVIAEREEHAAGGRPTTAEQRAVDGEVAGGPGEPGAAGAGEDDVLHVEGDPAADAEPVDPPVRATGPLRTSGGPAPARPEGDAEGPVEEEAQTGATPSGTGTGAGSTTGAASAPITVPGREPGTEQEPAGLLSTDTQRLADLGAGPTPTAADTGTVDATQVQPAVPAEPASEPATEATQVQPAVGAEDEPPAPPTRRSVRSAPITPRGDGRR